MQENQQQAANIFTTLHIHLHLMFNFISMLFYQNAFKWFTDRIHTRGFDCNIKNQTLSKGIDEIFRYNIDFFPPMKK